MLNNSFFHFADEINILSLIENSPDSLTAIPSLNQDGNE